MRHIYVISDLHLGGDPHDPVVPGGRGFQMCKQGPLLARFIGALADRGDAVELVIAGDFVDFLAERPSTGGWSPFHRQEAARLLRTIAEEREPEVFSALRRLLAAGHRLTVLLGNHDMELSLPEVRRVLEEVVGAGPGRDLVFSYDNEAWTSGDLIIEHGNRADPANEVDHDALRRVRVLQSRGLDDPRKAPFTPPVGSRIVAELMNPVKERFPFVDLLKPETTGLFPVLIALHPAGALKLGRLAVQVGRIGGHAAVNAAAPRYGQAIAGGQRADAVETTLKASLPDDVAQAVLAELRGGTGQAISGRRALSTLRAGVVARVLKALVGEDRTLDTSAEGGAEYLRAAEELGRAGWKVVVFGHTHKAVHQTLDSGALYLNTGTWADLITVPEAILSDDPDEARACCEAFLADLSTGALERWILRRPTYAHIVQDDAGQTLRAELCEYVEADPDATANVLDR